MTNDGRDRSRHLHKCVLPISYLYSGASRFINDEINSVSSVDNGIMYLQKQDLLEFCKFKLRRFSTLVCSA